MTLVLPTLAVNAQVRDMSAAKSVAQEFANKQYAHKRVANLEFSNKRFNVKSVSGDDAGTIAPFYLFADTVTSTCVIVSGDERMKTILAYTDQGTWCDDSLPPALTDLLNLYEQQYAHIQAMEEQPVATSESYNIPDISPLLTTTWNQGSPYNDLCPNDCPSGCVATAMSQVMKYHGYPQHGSGYFSYRSKTNLYNCEFDFSSATFHWEDMRDKYSSSAPIIQDVKREYIAEATYACGVAVGMDYDTDGSGAYMADVPYALINFFGYNKNVACLYRPYFKSAEWYSLLCNELANGRPVLYGGVDSRYGGHAFVIDGCNSTTGKFHVNWGWGGECDGYFELDALDPDVYKFSTYQDMLVNVSPHEVGTRQDVFYAQKFNASAVVGIGKTITFTLTDVFNFSSSSLYADKSARFYGIMGVGIYDEDFNYICSLDSCNIDGMTQFQQYSIKTFKSVIRANQFPQDGVYYIAPFVRHTDAVQPTRIRTMNASTDYLSITIDNGNIEGDDSADELEEVSYWAEDFENLIVPDDWWQSVVDGSGEWKVRKVLMQTDNSCPKAAKGSGYAYLEYSSSVNDLYNNRSITRLITDCLAFCPDSIYEMSFQCRKYTKNADATDLLSVYYEVENGWALLGEYPVMNQSEWDKIVLQLPQVDITRFAFEGNLSIWSTVFLDDIAISVNNSAGIEDIIINNDYYESVSVFTLSGQQISINENLKNTLDKLDKGIYIVRCGDKTKKVLIK